jgi:hypothetical protein
MGSDARPIGNPYLITSLPSAIGARATLCPGGNRSGRRDSISVNFEMAVCCDFRHSHRDIVVRMNVNDANAGRDCFRLGWTLDSNSHAADSFPLDVRDGAARTDYAIESVRIPRKIVSECPAHFARVCFVDDVTRYESAEPVCIDAAGKIVTGSDGAECAGVVVESGSVVNAGGFSDRFAISNHSLD